VRENRDGTLYSLTYQRLVSAAIDPIEKKPFYHFLPGSAAFSICTAGCNFSCLFCQNADTSQLGKDEDDSFLSAFGDMVTAEQIVASARKSGCASIVYTYTEPTIFYEYAFEIAKLAHEAETKNVFVTNGYIAEEPLREIAPYLDAANIDLKSFSNDFYKRTCGARLQPVLDTIKLAYKLGIWVELTTLVIPGENDSSAELEALTQWIVALSPDIPWHVSAFSPNYKMQDIPPASVQDVVKAIVIGQKAGLHYVYAGNIVGNQYNDTLCPHCGALLIKRIGYTTDNKLTKPICLKCKQKIAVVVK
jgi:pyruvate formate lyase activating enzyme